jgi:hypothetical protein
MVQSSTACIGIDVHKDSIEVAIADDPRLANARISA